MATTDQTKIIVGLSVITAIGAVYYFRSKKNGDNAKEISAPLLPFAAQKNQTAAATAAATEFKVYAKTEMPQPAPTMGGKRKSIVTPSGTYSWPLELRWDWDSREITNRSGKSALIGLPKDQKVVLADGESFSTITNSVSAAHWWA